MAVAALQLPQQGPISQAPFDWSPLAKLGDVYMQGQQQANQQSALSQLGNDPTQNAQILIKSGVPSLAQLGINLQQQQATSAESRREFDLQQAIRQHQDARAAAAERRTAEDWERQDPDAAAKLIRSMLSQQNPQAPAQAPFPAPLPGQAAPAQAAPPAPAQGVAPPPAAPPAPPAAVPAPPANAPDAFTSPIAPSQQGAALPAIAERVANHLASNQPAAAAGVTPDQIAELYRNPLTRQMATTLLQNQLSPGTWKVEKSDDGRLLAYNDKTLQSRDITPPTASGLPPGSKEQRERDERFADAKRRGYDDDTANFVAINKKLPKEDLSAAEIKTVNDLDNSSRMADMMVQNLKRLQELSPNAYDGALASHRATLMTSTLGDHAPQGALDTQELSNLARQNVALQAKATFGARLTQGEVNYLTQLESTPEMANATRQTIYKTLLSRFQTLADQDRAKSDQIKSGTYYKKGAPQAAPQATDAAPAAQATPPAATTAKPSLSEFMTKARAANPGVPDSELAQFWKQKYGG